MEEYAVKKLAGVLKVLVTAAFVCNLMVLPLVPGLVFASPNARESLLAALGLDSGLRYFALTWSGVWTDPYAAVLTVFLLFCGGCTALLLWQGRRVLDTILRGRPFSQENAASLRRAAVCAFFISAAAMVRVGWSCWFYRSAAPLATYNALFVPIFLMAGLLLLVMSALFRQAAQIKAENDLTI